MSLADQFGCLDVEAERRSVQVTLDVVNRERIAGEKGIHVPAAYDARQRLGGASLLHSVKNLFSPRIGVAWDPTGKGNWVVRGGFGIYNNWLTSANVQEEFRGNPPGLVAPTFVAGGSPTAQAPIFVQGTSSTPPFGFTFPTFQGGLNSQGGLVGARFGIGGINPNLKSPKADVWSLAVERKISNAFAASVAYSGSHSYNIVDDGNNTGGVSYGVNYNVLNDDKIINESLNAVGLNQSFGAIAYATNSRHGNYEGVSFDFKGHFSRGFFDASYTRSRSQDDAGSYPTPFNPGAYYGPSAWDVPSRFSLTFNYELKGLNGGDGALGHLTGGWGISGTSIFQSGEPFTVDDTNSYTPSCASATNCPSPSNPATGYAINPNTSLPLGGDFNADGVNLDYPDVTSYKQKTSRQAFLTGSIPAGNFAIPTFGLEGNEKTGQFREPNFAETDVNIYKETRISERFKFQIRFEFYNLFNRPNLLNVDTNWTDANFGQATASHLPRWWQLGGRLSF